MKRLIIISIFSLFIFSCGDKTREEITERYESGSKKLLLVFKGEGKNEKVSQRVDYWENGIEKRIINFNDRDTIDIIELLDDSTRKSQLYFNNRKYHGDFFDKYNNGNMMIKGTYSYGDMEGVWKKWYDNGILETEGQYKNNVQDGIHLYYDLSGDLIKKIKYNSSILTDYYKNDSIKKTYQLKDGYDFGKVTDYYENGQMKSIGNVIDTITLNNWRWDKDTSSGVDSFYIGRKYEGDYKGYHPNGQLKVEENNISWNNDGELSSQRFIYYENGQLRNESQFLNDKYDGNFILYYENGQISLKKRYKNGVLEGESISYYENGQLKEKSNYINGIKWGMYESYFVDGNIKIKYNIVDTLRVTSSGSVDYSYISSLYDGKKVEYFENGSPKEITNHKDGKKIGRHQMWYDDGTQIMDIYYKDDEEWEGYRIYYNDYDKFIKGEDDKGFSVFEYSNGTLGVDVYVKNLEFKKKYD